MSDIAAVMCPNHPGVVAQYTCSRCQSLCCLNCCYSMPDRSVCCSTCYNQAPWPVPAASIATPPTPVALVAGAVPVTRGCPQHPLLPPAALCRVCGAGSCVTCDFFFPPNIHLCPVCVVSSQNALTPMRKSYMTTALIMAGFASVGIVVWMSGMLAAMVKDDRTMAIIVGLGILLATTVPTTIGTGVAWAALRKGGPNPLGVWIGLVWNVLLLGVIILIMVVNKLSR
ncbi:MAG: hypothetical protein QOF48_1727 [Verrucomicrobiota bacterium]